MSDAYHHDSDAAEAALLAHLANHYGTESSKLAEVLMGDVPTDLDLLRNLPTEIIRLWPSLGPSARILAWMHGTSLAKQRRCREDDR